METSRISGKSLAAGGLGDLKVEPMATTLTSTTLAAVVIPVIRHKVWCCRSARRSRPVTGTRAKGNQA